MSISADFRWSEIQAPALHDDNDGSDVCPTCFRLFDAYQYSVNVEEEEYCSERCALEWYTETVGSLATTSDTGTIMSPWATYASDAKLMRVRL